MLVCEKACVSKVVMFSACKKDGIIDVLTYYVGIVFSTFSALFLYATVL